MWARQIHSETALRLRHQAYRKRLAECLRESECSVTTLFRQLHVAVISTPAVFAKDIPGGVTDRDTWSL